MRQPQSGYAADGSIGSKQVAEVTLPRSELDRIWSAEYLERLARTYWRFLTRVSLGLLRVLYTDDRREVVLLTRPFVLLRFHAPEYEIDADGGTVTWPIDRGLLVAPAGAAAASCGSACAAGRRADGATEATAVGQLRGRQLLPADRRLGLVRAHRPVLYNQTQLRIHVIVTNAFLRSLANLDLEQSRVGALRAPRSAEPARRGSPAASRDRGER